MSLRLRWTLLSALGLALGLVAALVLGDPIDAVVGMILVTLVLTGVVGAFLGTSQWVVLRKRLANARWWIPASAAGLGLGLTGGIVLVGRALKRGHGGAGDRERGEFEGRKSGIFPARSCERASPHCLRSPPHCFLR